jgi:hypothetical protein
MFFLCFVVVSRFGRWLRLGLASPRGGRDVNRGQDAKNVGLHHAGEQTERRHDDWE